MIGLPESSINEACGSWSEAKAAYRFFQNENVKEVDILASHIDKTVERTKAHKRVLVIQDTTYISYSSHKKTSGLGTIAGKGGKGTVMHTALAVSTEGLVLGILDQKIYSRPPISEEEKRLKSHRSNVHIEDKESMKWLESLKKTNNIIDPTQTEVITVCDREADIHDFFELAHNLNSAILVRARHNRNVNKKFMHTRNKQKLWSFIQGLSCTGKVEVEIPARDNKQKRTAFLEIRFGKFMMSPHESHIKCKEGHIKYKPTALFSLQLHAIHVVERNSPPGASPLEWMLLTNLSVSTFEEAVEKVSWYCLRWKIEILHKILKSGLKVEECRLGTAERLMRYLTVMSIIAWRIFFITSIARINPTLPCTGLLAEEEWKVLYVKIHKKPCPSIAPTIKEAVSWIAQLGGYLARKSDQKPGPITLWKGWRRLFDLAEGWRLAHEPHICG